MAGRPATGCGSSFPRSPGSGRARCRGPYAIGSLDEARAYLAHPILGPRLAACAAAVLAVSGRSAVEILGPVDALKLRSSMTLFHRAAPDEPLFGQVLDRYYDGVADPATDARLSS